MFSKRDKPIKGGGIKPRGFKNKPTNKVSPPKKNKAIKPNGRKEVKVVKEEERKPLPEQIAERVEIKESTTNLKPDAIEGIENTTRANKSRRELPKKEKINREQPKKEQPKKEQPKKEQPKKEQPKKEQPKKSIGNPFGKKEQPEKGKAVPNKPNKRNGQSKHQPKVYRPDKDNSVANVTSSSKVHTRINNKNYAEVLRSLKSKDIVGDHKLAFTENFRSSTSYGPAILYFDLDNSKDPVQDMISETTGNKNNVEEVENITIKDEIDFGVTSEGDLTESQTTYEKENSSIALEETIDEIKPLDIIDSITLESTDTEDSSGIVLEDITLTDVTEPVLTEVGTESANTENDNEDDFHDNSDVISNEDSIIEDISLDDISLDEQSNDIVTEISPDHLKEDILPLEEINIPEPVVEIKKPHYTEPIENLPVKEEVFLEETATEETNDSFTLEEVDSESNITLEPESKEPVFEPDPIVLASYAKELSINNEQQSLTDVQPEPVPTMTLGKKVSESNSEESSSFTYDFEDIMRREQPKLGADTLLRDAGEVDQSDVLLAVQREDKSKLMNSASSLSEALKYVN